MYDDSGASSAVAEMAMRREGPAPPPYRQRKGFRPRGPEDYGDGGAFPEIAMLQYPRNMGNPAGGPRSKALAVPIDASTGSAAHSALVVRGGGSRTVFASFTDVVERRGGAALERPSEEEEEETLARTQAALQSLVERASAMGRGVQMPTQSRDRHTKSQYVQYTASEEAAGYNPEAKHRLVRVVEAPQDPLDPPRHTHKKIPGGPPEDPVPVQHAPAGKVSAADQQAWTIPPAISNWKNAHGFTIPLHVRMAADGRRLQETVTNERHADLAHQLDVAEALAGKEVEARAKLQQRLAVKEKEGKEAELREMAARARLERTGVVPRAAAAAAPEDAVAAAWDTGHAGAVPGAAGAAPSADPGMAEREGLRAERKRERERELRMEASGKRQRRGDDGDDRDVSEKIALGMQAGQSLKGEAAFDTRLFAGGGGVGSGFGGEDADHAYSGAWRSKAVSSIYRPGKAGPSAAEADEALTKLQDGASSGFTAGADAGGDDFEGVGAGAPAARPRGAGLGSGGGGGGAAPARDGPVQFQRAAAAPSGGFGMDGIFAGGDEDARGGGKALQDVGKRGGMGAAAGGGGGGGARDATDDLDNAFE